MNNGFKSCHPTVNVLFYASVVVFSMLIKHPVCIAVSLLSSFACYLRLKGRAAVKMFFLFLLPMLVFVAAVNGLFAHYGVTPLAVLPDGNSLTFEALVYGFVLAVSVISVILWMFSYNEVVTAEKFMHVFGKRIPAVALVIAMSLRFIPMYKEQFHTIAQAQQGIGFDYKTGNLFQRIKNTGKILSMLLTWALENAIETADSMRARGYGLRGRKTYSRFRYTVQDKFIIVFTLVVDVLLAVAIVCGSLFAQYNPYIKINPEAQTEIFIEEFNIVLFPFTGLGYVAIAAYTLLSFLPLTIDLKEELKWQKLKSKI